MQAELRFVVLTYVGDDQSLTRLTHLTVASDDQPLRPLCRSDAVDATAATWVADPFDGDGAPMCKFCRSERGKLILQLELQLASEPSDELRETVAALREEVLEQRVESDNSTSSRSMTVQCGPELKQRIKDAARSRGLALSALAEQIFKAWLDANEPPVE